MSPELVGPRVLGIFDPIGDVVGGIIGDGVGNVAGSVAGEALDAIAGSMAEAVGNAVSAMSTFWTQVPTPALEGGAAATMQANLYYYMGAIAVLSVIVAGGRMAWEMKAAPGKDLARSMITLVLVSSGGIAAVSVLLEVGDAYSKWVLSQASDKPFGEQLLKMLKVVVQSGGPGVGAMMAIILGLFAVVLALMQVVMMVFRSAALVIAVGVWPLSAAATNTPFGRQWFTKITGWVVAFALYKPAAATVYAAAFTMFSGSKGILGTLMGLAAMGLALVAMPAMMKLAVPAVGGMAGSSGGGGGLMSGVGSGAMMLAGNSSASGGGGGSAGGGSGPSGATSAPSMQTYSEGPRTASTGASTTGSTAGATTGGGSAAAASAGGGGAASGAAAGGAAATGVGVPVAVAMVGAQAGTSAIKSAADGAADGVN